MLFRSEYDDPSFMPSDEEGKSFVDEFPSQLTEALLPLEAEQKQEYKQKKKRKEKKKNGMKRRREEESEDEEEEEDDGLFKDEFPKDLPTHPANFLWPDAIPKEKEKRDRPYADTDIYPTQPLNPYDGILPTGMKERKKRKKHKPRGFATLIPKEPKKKKQRKLKEHWETDNSDDEESEEEQKVANETWLNYNAEEIDRKSVV